MFTCNIVYRSATLDINMAVDKYLSCHVIRGLRNADVCRYLRCTSIDDDVQREAGIGVQLAARRDGIGIVEQVGRHTGYLIIEINGFYLFDRIVVAQAEGIEYSSLPSR